MQLCDRYTGYGTLQCYPAGSCPGSANGNCNPQTLWSSTPRSTDIYEHGWLNNGVFNYANGTNAQHTFAYTVRCVLDLGFKKYSAGRGLCSLALASLQTGSVTGIPVTAPCSAGGLKAAARAPRIITATRTHYGQAHRADHYIISGT